VHHPAKQRSTRTPQSSLGAILGIQAAVAAGTAKKKTKTICCICNEAAVLYLYFLGSLTYWDVITYLILKQSLYS